MSRLIKTIWNFENCKSGDKVIYNGHLSKRRERFIRSIAKQIKAIDIEGL